MFCLLSYKQVLEVDKYIISEIDAFLGFSHYSNNLYLLNLNNNRMVDCIYSLVDSDGFDLWHTLFGHVHYTQMKICLRMV